MTRRPILLLLGATLLSPMATHAQQPLDGPGGRFADDLLSKLEGEWLITRQIHGKTEQNTLSVTWELSHQFLQLRMKDTATPSRYEAIVLIGFIHGSGEYVAHWADTFGGKYSAVGKGIRVDNSVEFRFEYPDGPFFNTFTWSPEAGTWQMRLESQDKLGKRTLFALDTVRKTK